MGLRPLLRRFFDKKNFTFSFEPSVLRDVKKLHEVQKKFVKSIKLGEARAVVQNGLKNIAKNMFEIKINGNQRIIGCLKDGAHFIFSVLVDSHKALQRSMSTLACH